MSGDGLCEEGMRSKMEEETRGESPVQHPSSKPKPVRLPLPPASGHIQCMVRGGDEELMVSVPSLRASGVVGRQGTRIHG